MALLIGSAVLFLLVHFLNSVGGGFAAPQVGSVSPTWSADVHSAIGGSPIGVVGGGKGHEYEYQPRTTIWFTDNDTVVTTFATRPGGGSPKLSRRSASDPSLPLRLRAVFLDATTGKVKTATDWPARSRSSGIVATEDGKFVTQSGNDLILYAADLRELKKLQLPATEEPGWLAQASPTGKYILFIASNLRTRSAVRWVWVETDSLQVVRSWEEIQSGWVGISDSKIAMTRCVWFYDCEPSVGIRSIDEKWKTIASADRHSMPHPQFITDDLLVLLGRTTAVLRANGETIQNQDTPFEGCWWGGVYAAAVGGRFVIPSCKVTGRHEFLDIGGHEELRKILVYDSPFHTPPDVLDLGGPNVKGISLITLSPDGSRLAALSGESVYVFQLPGRPVTIPSPKSK